MRRFLLRNRWATLFVVVLLLFGTSGVGLTRMTCFSGGHSVLTIGAGSDCCPEAEPAAGAAFKSECCDVQLTKGDLSDLLPALQLELNAVHASTVDIPWALALNGSTGMAGRQKGRAPPGTALQRLAQLSQYRI